MTEHDAQNAQDARTPAPSPDGTTQPLSGAQTGHGFTCDPACRCDANIASGRGGNRKPIPPTHVLVQQVERVRALRDRLVASDHIVSLAFAADIDAALTHTETAPESKETAGKLASANRNVAPEPVSLVSADVPSLGDAVRELWHEHLHDGLTLGALERLAAQADRLEYERDKFHGHLIAANAMNQTALDQRNEARAQVQRVRDVLNDLRRANAPYVVEVAVIERLRAALDPEAGR
jgi:hypothetical protein